MGYLKKLLNNYSMKEYYIIEVQTKTYMLGYITLLIIIK